MLRRLTVIDGADQGRYFPLGEEGTLIIGTSHKRADIHLNDLYVSRVHCYVELADGMVVIADADDSNGTSASSLRAASNARTKSSRATDRDGAAK